MIATVPHVTACVGHMKHLAASFLLNRVHKFVIAYAYM